ncbi:hypothetical protein [Actinomadura opuntiae]|uniref:hypothetical protein n=1 Tax=Actinomadura sp. OS1-43 TaxID=604315 RepID=UPI00255AE0AA|nr:hypothetical protein [Actinomadura sp. OS1-43]MDL4813152.1 hypothetical protein [Actinomadura sp. OS1-43]
MTRREYLQQPGLRSDLLASAGWWAAGAVTTAALFLLSRLPGLSGDHARWAWLVTGLAWIALGLCGLIGCIIVVPALLGLAGRGQPTRRTRMLRSLLGRHHGEVGDTLWLVAAGYRIDSSLGDCLIFFARTDPQRFTDACRTAGLDAEVVLRAASAKAEPRLNRPGR